MLLREVLLLSTAINADVRYTKCQADELTALFNFTISDDVIVGDIECATSKAVDANTVELGSPDLWTHNLENGFYVIPFFFDADHTDDEKRLIRAATANFST